MRALDRYRFDLAGYLLIPDVLGRKTVDGLRRVIDAQGLPAADHTLARQRFGVGGGLFAWDAAFRDLIDHPVALAVLSELIGIHARLDHAYGITMTPGTSGLGLHGPAEPWDDSQYYVCAMGALRSGLLTLSWGLGDGRAGAGGFGCIPGSHKASGPRPAGAEDLIVEVPQPAGSLLVFTEALSHCTIPWQGPDTRWAVLYKYSPGSTAWDPNPVAAPDVIAGMTARQQRLCQPPYIGGRAPSFER
jgi:hypothetical protein